MRSTRFLHHLGRSFSTKPPKQKSLFRDLQPFIRFARPEYHIIGQSLGLLLISSAVTMSVPFVMGSIIDIVMKKDELGATSGPSKEGEKEEASFSPLKSNKFLLDAFTRLGSLPALFGALGAVFVVGAAANAGRQILMTYASERVITRLRTDLFKKILRQDIQFHDKNRSGELISRLSTDTVIVGKTLTNNVADGLRSLVMSATGLGAMLYVNVDLTATIMLIVPGISTIAIFYGRFVRKLAKDTTDCSAELTKFADEKISNIRTVRAFSQELTEVGQYRTRAQNVFDLGMKEGYASALFFSTMGFSGNIVILAILYYGGTLVHDVGTSLVGLSTWFSYLNKGAGSSERIFQLLQTSSAIESQDTEGRIIEKCAIRGNVKFENVEFAYPARPDAAILKGVSFDLPAGETIAIVGHSGSGKSTIAQILMRYYDPSSGSVTLDGVPIKEINPYWMRKNVFGYVSQEPSLFAATVMENIRYGTPEATDEDVFAAARLANAYDFIQAFPDGFNTQVGDRGHAISGGQKQRIAIARALLKNPQIILLDEATSALDSESENLVQEALDKLIAGRTRTVLIIAHRLSTIRKADRIYMLSAGRVIEHGSYQELLAKGGHFIALVGALKNEESN